MAQDFNIAAVTDAGRAAMQEALDNGYVMTFTKLATGNGSYASEEDVTGRTALKNQKNYYSFSSEEKDADGVTLRAVIVNQVDGTSVVPTTYNINEIGIFVSVNNVEVLYAVAAVGGGTGAELPAYIGDNAVQIVQGWYVANSNDVEITIEMTGAYALASDLEAETQARIEADLIQRYDLVNKDATIRTVDGNKQISESFIDSGDTVVTTIEQTSETVKTITAVITPAEGDYKYTKTTTITNVSGGQNVSDRVVRSAKGGE